VLRTAALTPASAIWSKYESATRLAIRCNEEQHEFGRPIDSTFVPCGGMSGTATPISACKPSSRNKRTPPREVNERPYAKTAAGVRITVTDDRSSPFPVVYLSHDQIAHDVEFVDDHRG
jgi:hypothetical protein